MDIDFLLRQMPLDAETIVKAMKEVVSIEVGDNVRFSFDSINNIHQEDEYGGYRVTILGRLENIKETVAIDIATGDPIVPEAVDYGYRCLFEDEVLHFQAYNFETILAEKLQTVLARGILNSRSKDYFDLYIIRKLRWEEIDGQVLKEAFSATCRYRNTFFSYAGAKQILDQVQSDTQMEQRWNSYRKKNKFVGDVTFHDAVDAALDVATYDETEYHWNYDFYEMANEQKDRIMNRLYRFRNLSIDMKKMYVPEHKDVKDPDISPLYIEDLSNFPPILMIEAEFDYYRICNEIFEKRLPEVEVLYYEGLDHGFFDRIGQLEQAKDCIDEIAKRVKAL